MKIEIPASELTEFRIELENQLSTIERDFSALEKKFASLKIDVDMIPGNVQKELDAVVNFQILHRIDEIDDVSIPLGFSESVLAGVKASMLDRQLKREARRLNKQQNQLKRCMKILKRDEKSYETVKKEKERENLELQSENVLSQPQLNMFSDFSEDQGIESFISKVKTIKELREKKKELLEKTEAENLYLQQFDDVPPSIPEAARCLESQKKRATEIEHKLRCLQTVDF